MHTDKKKNASTPAGRPSAQPPSVVPHLHNRCRARRVAGCVRPLATYRSRYLSAVGIIMAGVQTTVSALCKELTSHCQTRAICCAVRAGGPGGDGAAGAWHSGGKGSRRVARSASVAGGRFRCSTDNGARCWPTERFVGTVNNLHGFGVGTANGDSCN